MRLRRLFPLLVLLVSPVAQGCGATSQAAPTVPLTVGLIYVGSTDDGGYNEAAHEGALAIARAFPHARILEQEHVPEDGRAATAMEAMIADGATIIFPTSFGHLQPALEVAARHPDVTFLHQGGQQTAANLGTYFATIWEAEYAAGVAAGLTTRTDRLGFVAAFPIAQSLLTINAFQLGARSVNPRVRTRVVFTGTWCDPARQRRAARALLARHADVLTQHQDCTAAVQQAAQDAGVWTTGYHFDARDRTPDAWLTGARWDWRVLFVDMVRTIRDGRFATSRYAGRLRVGLRDGQVGLSRFGPRVPPAVRARVAATLARLRDGQLRPFTGPLRDQRGGLRIPAAQPSTVDLEEMDYLVEGVDGDLG